MKPCLNCQTDHHNICDKRCVFYTPELEKIYEFYYVDDRNRGHCLKGPTYIHESIPIYQVHGINMTYKAFINHPKVIEYQYLLDHPELKAFI